MPEGSRLFLVGGAPWWVGRVWQVLKKLVPARTLAKVQLFRSDAEADFRAAVAKQVAPEQTPPWCGGVAAQPWPYGEGGDVPSGGGS